MEFIAEFNNFCEYSTISMKAIIKSFRESFAESLSRNEYVIKYKEKYPAFFTFLKKRLSFSQPYGFYFSAGVIASSWLFIIFLGLIQDVVSKEAFVQADLRIMNLVTGLRVLWVAKFFLWVTYLGDMPVVLGITLMAGLVLVSLNERRMARFLVLGVSGGAVIATVFKLLLRRARPDIGFSMIHESSYSFPSGHAVISMVLFGMLGYFVFRKCRKWWQKILVTVLAMLIIVMVGFSRIYLGVHWASDVVAGWVIGLSWLILLLAFFEQAPLVGSNSKGSNPQFQGL